MHPTETAIVQAFIAGHRRARWLMLLDSAKRRHRFLDCLNHCGDLDPRYVRPLASNADVVELLRANGASETSYIVSATAALDGRELQLDDAVREVHLGGWGSIISCIPGRLAYYYDECGERRALLVRNDDSRNQKRA